jgi:hypothetical protein
MALFSRKSDPQQVAAEQAAAHARANRLGDAWDDYDFVAHSPAEKARAMAVIEAIERNHPRRSR